MQTKNPSFEVLNFGVDGYSMGQCLLRYRMLKDEIDYDIAVLVFVPSCDLEQDINTYRRLLGWESWKLMPRFIIENKRLILIKGPYKTSRSFCIENRGKISKKCLNHLKRYDRLYIPTKFENIPLAGNIILFKLIIGYFNRRSEIKINRHLYEPDSEAMCVSRKIFKTMENETVELGKEFFLFVLPNLDELRQYRKNPAFKDKWNRMIQSIYHDNISCIDFVESLSKIPEDQLDKAQDGHHYGEKTNEVIADIVLKSLNNAISSQ